MGRSFRSCLSRHQVGCVSVRIGVAASDAEPTGLTAVSGMIKPVQLSDTPSDTRPMLPGTWHAHVGPFSCSGLSINEKAVLAQVCAAEVTVIRRTSGGAQFRSCYAKAVEPVGEQHRLRLKTFQKLPALSIGVSIMNLLKQCHELKPAFVLFSVGHFDSLGRTAGLINDGSSILDPFSSKCLLLAEGNARGSSKEAKGSIRGRFR